MKAAGVKVFDPSDPQTTVQAYIHALNIQASDPGRS